MKNTMLAGACVAVVAALATAPAEARMSKAEVARALEQTYPVRVLTKHTKLAQFDGKPVYEVKVMNTGGDFNAAFMITTLVVAGAVERGSECRLYCHGPEPRHCRQGPARTLV